ncbi:MAG: hypothetical protein ACHRHE_12920, partial [Tepidisphaerales bacterium]
LCVLRASALLSIAASPLFAAGSAGLKLEQLAQTAHGTWGNTVTLSIVLRNTGATGIAGGSVEVLLNPRAKPAEEPRTLTRFATIALPPGQSLTKDVVCILPKPPDPQGRGDGDFDIIVAFRADNAERVLLGPSHPIHIETRDESGKIGGNYLPRVYDLVAANAAPGKPYPDWLVATGIRNSRDSVAWGAFEPADGKWDQKQFGPASPLGSLILQARKYDMTTIPTLLNIPEWAQRKNEAGRKRGPWAPPADPARWAAFVDKVVGYYCREPYCQRDWQVWNEAGELDASHCFWDGTMAEYVETVHNPAAQAIRKHHVGASGRQGPGERCRVVYGGLPDTDARDGRYARVLDLRGCGELTDILDAHYVSNLQWFADQKQSGDVYSPWVKTGRARGCWITEDGWGRADKPEWAPGYYFNAIQWALDHDWSHKDKYRVYFFHYYAAEENKGFFWIDNNRKWPNGYSIRTLMDLFQGDLAPAGPARRIEATHGVEVGALLAGGRLLAMPFSENFRRDGQARVGIRLKPDEKVASVSRITAVKGIKTSIRFEVRDGRLEFDFAWKNIDRSVEGMNDPLTPVCYLVVECDRDLTTWK